jgi:uncharacterized protein YbjQ (UPF0145 family)
MHVRNHALIFLSVVLFSGCGTTKLPPTVGMDHLSPEQLNALEVIKIYSQTKTIKQQFDTVTTVQGISCKSSMWGKAATRRDAILQTRYRAQQAGADAIIYLRCDHQRDAAYDCSEIVICNGEAIKFK